MGTISQRFFAVPFFVRFCAELFSSALLRGILPRALSQEPFICSLCRGIFLSLFRKCFFRGFFCGGILSFFEGVFYSAVFCSGDIHGLIPVIFFPALPCSDFFRALFGRGDYHVIVRTPFSVLCFSGLLSRAHPCSIDFHGLSSA